MTGTRLSTRVALAFSALFLVTSVAVMGATLFVTTSWVETAVDDNLASVADEAARRIGSGALPPARVVDELASASQFVEFRDPEGRVLASASVLDGRVIPVGGGSFHVDEGVFSTASMTRSRVRVITEPVRDGDGTLLGYVVAATPTPGVGPNTRELGLLVAAAGAAGLLVTIAATLLLSRWVAQPITALATHVRAEAGSGFLRPIAAPAKGSIEVRELGMAINDLIERQREQLERERAFLADSSHVLRTPLAVLRGNVDLLDDGRSDSEGREALTHVRAALESMSRTVGGLLLLAREEGVGVGDWQIVDLTALVGEVVSQAHATARDDALVNEPAPAIEVSGDPHQLRDLLAELVENATRYTPAGGRVTVRTLALEAGSACVEVEDTGIGLSTEEAQHARDRFFRGYRARLLFPGGTGLGLAIAEHIARMHGGSLELTSRAAPRGTTARLILPRFENDPEGS